MRRHPVSATAWAMGKERSFMKLQNLLLGRPASKPRAGCAPWLFFALIGLWVVGCDALPQPPVAPTFIPPTVANPGVNPATGGSARSVGTSKGPSLVSVTRGSIAQLTKARGRVISQHEAFLYFPLKGAINKINVAAGDQVIQGAPLAELDTYYLDEAVEDAQFDLDQANFQLRQTQARLGVYDFRLKTFTTVESETRQASDQAWQAYQPYVRTGLDSALAWERYTRFQDLNNKHLRAADDLNTVKADQQVATIELEEKKQAVLLMQKKLSRAQKRRASAKLTAPFSGLLVSIDKKIGDEALAFESIGAIADPAQLQLEANVPEVDAGNLGLGQAVGVVLDGFPSMTIPGKVSEIAAKASIFQGKSVYRFVVSFDNPSKVPATMRMGADVSWVAADRNNVLIVPTNAIVAVGAKKFVTAVRDGKPQPVEVQVGVANDTQSEILFGVSEGEQVQVP